MVRSVWENNIQLHFCSCPLPCYCCIWTKEANKAVEGDLTGVWITLVCWQFFNVKTLAVRFFPCLVSAVCFLLFKYCSHAAFTDNSSMLGKTALWRNSLVFYWTVKLQLNYCKRFGRMSLTCQAELRSGWESCSWTGSHPCAKVLSWQSIREVATDAGGSSGGERSSTSEHDRDISMPAA